MLWEHWITSFTWAIIAKHRFYLTPINFAKTLTAAQFSDLPDLSFLSLIQIHWLIRGSITLSNIQLISTNTNSAK